MRDKLISMQTAIDTIRTLSADGDFVERVEWMLGQVPPAQPEQRWIPVSEKLPDGIYPVLVTWKNEDPESYYQYILGHHYVGVAHFKNNTWYWYSSVTEDVLMEYGTYKSEEFDEAIQVLAWMPLPEPWEGGAE